MSQFKPHSKTVTYAVAATAAASNKTKAPKSERPGPAGGHCSRYPGRRKHWSNGHAKATNANKRAAKKNKGNERGHRERALRKLRSAARKGGAKIKSIRITEGQA